MTHAPTTSLFTPTVEDREAYGRLSTADRLELKAHVALLSADVKLSSMLGADDEVVAHVRAALRASRRRLLDKHKEWVWPFYSLARESVQEYG